MTSPSHEEAEDLVRRLRRAGLPPDLSPTPSAPPGYRDMVEIARGGQGVVFRAIQDSTGRVVAIKMLGDLEGGAWRRFAREIEIVATLDHPNIVTIFDSGFDGGRRYLVMDHIDGRRLDEAASTMSRVEALSLFVEVCRAVSHAHQIVEAARYGLSRAEIAHAGARRIGPDLRLTLRPASAEKG